jgi:hypothetical protein
MKIETLLDLWTKESKIDDLYLDLEAAKVPSLHARFLTILSKERSKLRALETKRKGLIHTLTEYYRGNLNNPEDLKRVDREPFKLTIIKEDQKRHIDADKELIALNMKIMYQQELVDVSSEIMKSINNRSFYLRDAIEWRKLTQFGVG